MAEAAQIGANFSDYVGNAALGGAGLGVFQIDTRPLQNLAAYTFSYNSAINAQKQKDIEAKAKQLADITAYDLNSAIPKDRQEIQKGYEELYKFVQENPTVLDYQNNQKGWMEYNKKKNEFENKLQGGKVRSVLYSAREKEVSEATSPQMKKFLQDQLDQEANSTDLMTPLKHTQLYDIAPVEVTAPPVLKLDVTHKAGNFITSREYDLIDMASVDAQAQAKNLGLLKGSKDPNSPEFQVQSASGKLEPIESSKVITSVLLNPKYQDPKFKNEDGTLNIDLVIKDNASNGLVSGVLTSVEQFNKQMREMKAHIVNGDFTDKLGKQLGFGAGGLNEYNWREIDISDGVSSDELLRMRITGLAKPQSYKTEVKQTNESLQSAQLAETIRNNKADQYLKSKDQKLAEDKWKASVTGGTTQVNGAMERAKRIYADLVKLSDKTTGVIYPDKIRQLNVEQLKYLGIEVPQERDPLTGIITNSGGFKPLELDKTKEYAIQLVNGEIKVLTPENGKDKLSRTPSGGFEGLFDNTKSTNLFNIGTNILNEELKNAGTKELNSYMGVDVTDGITQNTDGGTTTVSGATKTPIPITGKIDINSLQVGQPYSVSGKIYIWDGKKLKAQ